MSDIVKRLHAYSEILKSDDHPTSSEIMAESAAEIERLRKLLIEAGNWISVSIPSNGALVARIVAAIGGKNND